MKDGYDAKVANYVKEIKSTNKRTTKGQLIVITISNKSTNSDICWICTNIENNVYLDIVENNNMELSGLRKSRREIAIKDRFWKVLRETKAC